MASLYLVKYAERTTLDGKKSKYWKVVDSQGYTRKTFDTKKEAVSWSRNAAKGDKPAILSVRTKSGKLSQETRYD